MAIRYIVNKKDRIVIAVLNDCRMDAINTANSWTGYWDDVRNVQVKANYNKKYLIPNKFTGIARCSVNDEWNEEIGKQIARDRLLNKYHKSLNKAIRKIDYDFAMAAHQFSTRVSKLRETK